VFDVFIPLALLIIFIRKVNCRTIKLKKQHVVHKLVNNFKQNHKFLSIKFLIIVLRR
jgi:hypothetical protein